MTHRRTAPRTLKSTLLLTACAAASAAWAVDPHARPTKPVLAPSSKTATAPAVRAPQDNAVVDEANLDKLRERLAEKLGATRPPDAAPGAAVVRVVSKPTLEEQASGDLIARPPAARPKAPRTAKAVDGAHGTKTAGAGGAQAPHWAYSGQVGPQAWGGLQADFSTCAKGARQSPIDIRDGISVDLEPVMFDYRASGFRVIDNGHTVQVNVASGNSIQVTGRRYELVQFHFHRPSEERIDGRQFDMVAHLVHKDVEGRLAVVAVLLDRGSIQPLVQTVWNNLPLEKHEEVAARAVVDLNHLLPPDRRYYTYMGSLTTPPCTEGVLWVVMRQPVGVSPEQIDIFSRLYPMNARPVQSASGRMIKQSN